MSIPVYFASSQGPKLLAIMAAVRTHKLPAGIRLIDEGGIQTPSLQLERGCGGLRAAITEEKDTRRQVLAGRVSRKTDPSSVNGDSTFSSSSSITRHGPILSCMMASQWRIRPKALSPVTSPSAPNEAETTLPVPIISVKSRIPGEERRTQGI
ncbi:hypothetical protein BDZ89DRAFT_533437 [Hymenopellis radicata]|nr:hypothetical protein BDZ89DRAFT_533437 [Hymenopellis radicata]